LVQPTPAGTLATGEESEPRFPPHPWAQEILALKQTPWCSHAATPLPAAEKKEKSLLPLNQGFLFTKKKR